MKIIKINEDFNLKYVNSLVQFWQNTRSFHCIGRPKGQNLLLFLDGISIVYTNKEGKTLTAHSGEVVYSPEGSEYRASLFNFRDEKAHTVGINFRLCDERGEKCVLSEDLAVYRLSDPRLSALFHRVATQENSASALKKRISVLEILSALTEKNGASSCSKIRQAAERLSEHPEENPSVASLAKECGMSQVYFSKLFRKDFGVTPATYRNRLRLERAASYLEYGQISVQEISDTLGYGTASHFIKSFRECYGVSPAKYRKAFQDR